MAGKKESWALPSLRSVYFVGNIGNILIDVSKSDTKRLTCYIAWHQPWNRAGHQTYRLIDSVNSANIMLQIHSKSRILPKFHVDLLKSCAGCTYSGGGKVTFGHLVVILHGYVVAWLWRLCVTLWNRLAVMHVCSVLGLHRWFLDFLLMLQGMQWILHWINKPICDTSRLRCDFTLCQTLDDTADS